MTTQVRSPAHSAISFFATVAVVAAVDLWSKAWMSELLAPTRRTIEVAPFFNLCLGHNPGISFGLFPASTDEARAALLGVAVVLTLLVIALGLRARQRLERLGFALIAGGAVGNAADRRGDGYVTDFLDFHAFGWHWPTFNLADVAITFGVIALLVASFAPIRPAASSEEPTT